MAPPSTSSGQATPSRPPIVVVLGHVDHGKTTLLDTVRKTSVASGESGGITQHIGAYQTEHNGRMVTFLDTPGHEAFSAIRSRGAKVADVAVLVVAADESLKPQTKEAIEIIKQAGIPFVVAINKIDKPGTNIDKVKQDLAQAEVLVESWGGQVPSVELSAKTGAGVPELLDMILLVADLLELKASPTVTAKGLVIESHKDQRRGFVATVLVQEGTLTLGDWIVVDHVVGKVKSMEDFRGATIDAATPAQPALVTGWPEAPRVGSLFRTAPAKKAAEDLAADAATPPPPTFETFRKAERTLNILLKADVASSLEALELSIKPIGNEQVAFRILDAGVGSISETDVQTAAAKGAIIYGFRVAIEPAAQKRAERDGIRIRVFEVIYELIEAFRVDLAALLPTQTQRTVIGKLRVLAIFKTDPRSIILGGRVTQGKVSKGSLVDLAKGDTPIRIGKITSLQQEKEDTAEVASGADCGMRIDTSDFSGTIQENDTLEFISEEQVKQSL